MRQLHHRSGNVGEAEGFVAFLAMEMGVQVAYVARATVAAHGILEGTRPVIYTVYQMMGEDFISVISISPTNRESSKL